MSITTPSLERSIRNILTEPLDAKTIIPKTVAIMEAVETVAGMSGQQKKNVVLSSINDRLLVDEDSSGLKKIVASVLPAVIDYVVIADKNGLALNPALKKKCTSIFSCC